MASRAIAPPAPESARPAVYRTAAVLMAVIAGVHFQQYVDFMSEIPTIGVLFLLNAAGGAGLAVALLSREPLLRVLAALGSLGLALGSLVSIFLALSGWDLWLSGAHTTPTDRDRDRRRDRGAALPGPGTRHGQPHNRTFEAMTPATVPHLCLRPTKREQNEPPAPHDKQGSAALERQPVRGEAASERARGHERRVLSEQGRSRGSPQQGQITALPVSRGCNRVSGRRSRSCFGRKGALRVRVGRNVCFSGASRSCAWVFRETRG